MTDYLLALSLVARLIWLDFWLHVTGQSELEQTK